MLKSRRGLFAAGLAVAVVGAFGVVTTLNAGADQIENAPETAAPPAAVAEVAPPAPPAVLPWGERPKKVKKGRAGMTSRTLRAQGLSAAANDAAESRAPRAKFGPKGRSNGTNILRTEQTEIAPPEPLAAAAAPEEQKKVNYFYSVGSQEAETEGLYANITISKPKLDTMDYHTLAELAVQSKDGRQIVEVGWTVDRVVNGDDDPHLFVFHWVDRKPGCYNGCGFQQYSPNIKPGDTLAYGVNKKFGIQYVKNAWWIAYDSEWIGYFPDTLWSDKGVTFNRSGLLQVFGEVASTTTTPCSEMGTGAKAGKDNAARLYSVSYINGPAVDLWMRGTTSVYGVAPQTARSFRYGGPGACVEEEPEES